MSLRCLFGHRYAPRASGVRRYCIRRGCSEYLTEWRFD